MKTVIKITLLIYVLLSVKLFIAEYFFQKDDIHRAYSLQKTNARYLNALGRHYEKEAAQKDITAEERRININKSEEFREEAIRQSPNEGEYYASYAWLMGNLGKSSQAVNYYEKALVLQPHSRRISRLYKQYLDRQQSE